MGNQQETKTIYYMWLVGSSETIRVTVFIIFAGCPPLLPTFPQPFAGCPPQLSTLTAEAEPRGSQPGWETPGTIYPFTGK